MSEAAAELLKYGVTGVVAVIFLWLYMNERKEHRHTQDKLLESYSKRVEEARDTISSIKEPISSLAVGIRAISDKIDDNRRG